MQPFSNTRDSRFYFDSASHQSALADLMGMLDDGNRGWASLSGAAGTGKTMLRTVLHRQLDRQRFVVISIETSLLDFDELLLEIISQMRGDRAYASELPDRYSRLSEFKLLLSEYAVQSGRQLVLLIDEAQGLEKSTLEYLRNLSNICAEQNNLMSIVLIGGKRLETTLRSLPELAQRLAVRSRLDAMDLEQTGDYLQHRLSVAGWTQPHPFNQELLQQLHQATRGIPREINHILGTAVHIAMKTSGLLSADCLAQALKQHSGGNGPLDDFQGFGIN